MISPISANVNVMLYVAPEGACVARLCMCHIVQIDTIVFAMSNLSDCGVNPLGPRILLKHATMFPGFLANFERFYLLVLKNL